ncbi:MAG: hypothetical protein AB1467_02140 [Candidatus Diapherotrites archaeon]
MVKYNGAFFGLYENLFLVIKKECGEKKALKLFTKIMVKGLKKAYDKMGFKKGKPEDFVKVVGARDKGVGLKVRFPKITQKEIVYQFYTDPFPNLKGKVSPEKLDAAYMQFKVNYLLGNNWQYKTRKHIWKGDNCTEHLITKK